MVKLRGPLMLSDGNTLQHIQRGSHGISACIYDGFSGRIYAGVSACNYGGAIDGDCRCGVSWDRRRLL
jgi:hypothetical protein